MDEADLAAAEEAAHSAVSLRRLPAAELAGIQAALGEAWLGDERLLALERLSAVGRPGERPGQTLRRQMQ